VSWGGGFVTLDPNGNKETETDRRGITRRNTYDELNRLRKVEIVSGVSGEGPIGQVAAYGYDLAGNKTSETDVNGLVTEFRYDGLYQLERKILPVVNPQTSLNYEELYRYDKVGNLRRFTDPNGKATETEYDNLNRPTKVTRDVGGLGLVTTTTYDDPEGSHVNKSEEKDVAKGLRTSFLYDELNREKERKVHLEGEDGDTAPNPGPYTTTTVYVDSEHAVRITDPRGVKVLRRLDGLDRVIEETVDVDGLAGAQPLGLITTIAYDGLGNRKEVTDPENRTTSFDHDGLGRLTKTTDARLQETSYSYFGDGLKESETDRRGVKKLFTYDNLGRLRKTKLDNTPFSGVPWSHETQYVDALQPKRIEIDARGKKTIFDLDGLGRVIQETDRIGNFRTFTWDGVNKIAETDKRRNETRFEYDGVNRLTKTTDPAPFAGQTVETTYQDALNRVIEKDRRGTLKRTQTDPLGRVLTITEAAGAAEEAVVERNTWDGNGNRETQTDGEGHVTRFLYDAANRVSSRTDGFGTAAAATTTYVYDKVGNLLEERDARAVELGEPWSVKKMYDELNRLLTQRDAEQHESRFGWDPEGNKNSEETPRGQITTTLHDELGKPLDVTQPPPKAGEQNLVTRFRYDENRNLVEMQDADGRVTKLDYDELNRLFRTTRDPGGLALVSETTDFDEDGRPLRIAEANGEATVQVWDELGRLSTRTHAPPVSGWTAPWQYTGEERYRYDPNSNLERVEEHDLRTGGGTPPVRVTTRGYDRLDRQTSETVTLQDSSTKSVTTEYWKNGQVKSVTDPQGATSYTYDGQGREQTVTTSAGETRKTYHPDGLVKDITFPNLTKRAHGYDKADRLLSIVTTKDAATVASTAYTYDPNGNRLTQVQTNGGVEETTTYTYDDVDRLATVTYAPDAEHPNGRKVTYGHDGAGNRKTEVVTDLVTEAVLESKTGHFDNANRLTELTDSLDANQTTTLAWDRNGNLLSETKAGVTTSYRYDLRDTLAEVERGGQTLARFLGDFDERRVLKIGDPTRPGGSGVQEYVYNGSRLVLDVENGQPVSRYEWTNEELVSLLQSGGQRRYFALDGLETVLALTDEAGLATDRLNFDAWGVPKEGTDFGTSGSRFAFTSHRFDTELDLYYAGGRMYSPTIGRFISQDTLSLDPNNPETWNLFNYVRSNPTRYVDPTGHQTEPVAGPDFDEAAALDARLRALKAQETKDPVLREALGLDRPSTAPTAEVITEEDSGGFWQGAKDAAAGALGWVGEKIEQAGDAVEAWLKKKWRTDEEPNPHKAENAKALEGLSGLDETDRRMLAKDLTPIQEGLAEHAGEATKQAIYQEGLPAAAGSLKIVGRGLGKGRSTLGKAVRGVDDEAEAILESGARGRGASTRAAIPEGTGPYRGVRGHHVHAKAGFRGHATYDPKQGFSISQDFMESRNWSHQDMTATQRQLFDELAASGRPNTLKEHTRIAVEALKSAGAPEAEARKLVAESLRDLRAQGVRAPTRVPWN
jgi:RHS repeat-associated protein